MFSSQANILHPLLFLRWFVNKNPLFLMVNRYFPAVYSMPQYIDFFSPTRIPDPQAWQCVCPSLSWGREIYFWKKTSSVETTVRTSPKFKKKKMDTFYCSNSYIFPLALYLFIGLSDKKKKSGYSELSVTFLRFLRSAVFPLAREDQQWRRDSSTQSSRVLP